ncbi:MAG: ATP-dependent DNA helicase [Minisyncoccia bacterium]
MPTTPAFEKAYKELNTKQKEAVDTVEGPVLVIAGPGTGKTHILTLRIANILRLTQAKPSNILALTFTDSAASTMRKRLADIVGEEVAREVSIHTFHGFCQSILEHHPEYFPEHAARRLMGDVEQVLLLREAIETTDIKEIRPPKAPYTYLDDMKRLYDTLAREGVTLAEYQAWGDLERARIKADESLQYKRGEKVGELTKDGLEKLSRIDKVDEVVRVIKTYEDLKEGQELYDFSDILRVAINRISENDTLRAELQEQFQYVLADEHQDANALQHRLLSFFAIDDFPNLFIVGDEKQAIYRFQGAEAGGFADFVEQFPRAAVVTLDTSFRSYQHVLDTAHEVIESTGTHTKLAALRGEKGPNVSLIIGNDPLDERSRIVRLIQKLIEKGTLPHDIAVIARKNETADLIALELEALGTPALRAGDISLMSRPLPRALLSLMHYIADPTNLSSLRSLLLAPWWGNALPEVLMLLRTTSDKELVAKLEETFPATFVGINDCLQKSLGQTPIECFSYVFTTSGARDYLLSHPEYFDDIAIVRQLMMHLEEVAFSNQSATFADVMHTLAKALEHDISPLKTSVTEREGSVTVITAHKAKGMEFSHVFIPDLTEQGWEKGGRPALIPSPFENKQSLDDVRRLLYVALTRAKDHAYVSYAHTNKDGKERKISTLLPHGLFETKTESSSLPLLHQSVKASELIVRLTKRYLTVDGLAPTALNEYLISPASFFATRVLRIKEPPAGPAVLGSAVHTAIAMHLSGKTKEESFASLRRVFSTSLLARTKVFDDLLQEALAVFEAYLKNPLPQGIPTLIEKKFTLERKVGDTTVRMQGKIDAAFDTGSGLCIVDFKTGSGVSAKNEDYIRQLMLYAHLLEQNGENPVAASLISLTSDGVKELPLVFSKEAIAQALSEFDVAVVEMLSGTWRKGEFSSYDALLSLLKNA